MEFEVISELRIMRDGKYKAQTTSWTYDGHRAAKMRDDRKKVFTDYLDAVKWLQENCVEVIHGEAVSPSSK